MMGSLSNVIVIVTMVTLVPLVTCQLCETGVEKPHKTCSDQCIQNSTCSCEAQIGTGILHCKQFCSYFTKICSSMSCRGGFSCSQYCGKALCNMTCADNSDFCRQNCTSPGKCDVIKCSSAKCDQRCANCTMICTSDVEKCKQTCLGGSCDLKCAARNCVSDCQANNTRCDVDERGKISGGSSTNCSLMLVLLTIVTVLAFG